MGSTDKRKPNFNITSYPTSESYPAREREPDPNKPQTYRVAMIAIRFVTAAAIAYFAFSFAT